jgi:hypothetical protein
LSSKNRQAGYLYEVPLLVMAVIVILTVLLPHLPIVVRKIFAIAGGIVVIAGLYYMIVIPGWQGNTPRLRRPWSVIIFLIIALFIALIAALYVMRG